MTDEPVPRPVVTERVSFSPAIDTLIMSDGTTLYGCSWPGCQMVAPRFNSVGAHHKVHTGKAAQRRRAERKPKQDGGDSLLTKLIALGDMVQDIIDEWDAYEEGRADEKRRAEMYDAIRGLLE